MTEAEIKNAMQSLAGTEEFIKNARAVAEPVMQKINAIHAKSLRRTGLMTLVTEAWFRWKEDLSQFTHAENDIAAVKAGEKEERVVLGRCDFVGLYSTVSRNEKIIVKLGKEIEKYYEENHENDEKEIKTELEKFEKYHNDFLALQEKVATLLTEKRPIDAAKLCLQLPRYPVRRLFVGEPGEERGLCEQYSSAADKYRALSAWVERTKEETLPRAALLSAQIEVYRERIEQKQGELLTETAQLSGQVLSSAEIEKGLADVQGWYRQMDHSLIVLQNGSSDMYRWMRAIAECQAELKKHNSNETRENS